MVYIKTHKRLNAGKNQTTADALSRAPHTQPEKADINVVNDAALYAEQTIKRLPASSNKLEEIKELQKQTLKQRKSENIA